jgi:thiol-disulfide isomerase/thioredoxin
MKRFVLLLAGLSLVLQASVPTPLQQVDETGFQKLIAAQKGKVILVDFWATWCRPCRAEMPELVKLESRLRAQGVKLITVSADEPEKATEALNFASEVGVPMPAYIRHAKDDDKFINFVDPKWSGALPALILYDKQGRHVKSFVGETPMMDIEAAVRKLL